MPEPLSPREQKRALQREQAQKIHARDPELSTQEIADQIGARKQAVSAWLNGETRTGRALK